MRRRSCAEIARTCSNSIRKNTRSHLQLGGCEPGLLAEAAAIGASFGYDEINLNVGCPSDRVQRGDIRRLPDGARRSLGRRLRPCDAGAVGIPVTVKCRIGIDDQDHWDFLRDFVGAVADAGCGTIIVHARKAILKGLSPKQNREVPPLDYARAWQVKEEFPALTVVVNGGLRTVPQVTEQLAHADGVMLGREAYHNPYLLPALHRAIYDDAFETPTAATIAERMRRYAERAAATGTPPECRHPAHDGPVQRTLGAHAAGDRALSEGVSRGSPTPALIQQALRAAENGSDPFS